ncbi:hypothetical protein DM02DRAFT_616373 [Periconia macrospinosa]|uniref:Secreted protein n=1 Tax=Periconia macrospinosa TaxID=97972 RepID=A0A2V1DI88_9PLEO|nr:hypothetical protein DM02DRAFT_616373 [Periconia macrospinosa]
MASRSRSFCLFLPVLFVPQLSTDRYLITKKKPPHAFRMPRLSIEYWSIHFPSGLLRLMTHIVIQCRIGVSSPGVMPLEHPPRLVLLLPWGPKYGFVS